MISCEKKLLDPIIANHLEFNADSVWSLTSFKDHTEMKIGDYDGTFRLLKQYNLHSLCGFLSDFDVYALKLKGKSGI